MRPARILFAGLFHESHSFLTSPSRLDDFEQLGYGSDRDINLHGTPMAAAIDECQQQAQDVEMIVGPYLYAMPGGPVESTVVDLWKERFSTLWTKVNHECDAIFLVLHGAMVTDEDHDVEGSLVSWIRTLPDTEKLPIHAVLDLHGNISKSFTKQINCVVAYRNNPHSDACEAARDSARLLIDSIKKQECLSCHWLGAPIVWPPSGTGTAEDPMLTLESCARAMESQTGIHVANVFAGYAYADTPHTNVSFCIITDESLKPQSAQAALEELKRIATRKQSLGIPKANTVEELLDALNEPREGPILVAEPSDNIGAGAPGDCTGLLRLFIKHRIKNSGVVINDPESVEALRAHAPNDKVKLCVGGKNSPLDEGPIECEVTLKRLFDGRFNLEDPQSHLASVSGTAVEMGSCALVTIDGVMLLLTTHKTPPFDLGQWRVAGINPEELDVIAVKAAVAYRQAYDPIAHKHLTIDTPGPCQLNLKAIPYKHIQRPIFPLDES